MIKIDHRKTLKHLYHPSSDSPALVDVPEMAFLMLDGTGRPNGKAFQEAASALYPLAYTLKFMAREAYDIDFHVMPMEVRWRVNRETKEFAWTMMLMQPEQVKAEAVAEARTRAASKVDAALLAQVRFETWQEGTCIQLLHLGPYAGMDAAMQSMVAAADAQGYAVPVQNAHDIYLNDVRKTKPENLEAVMRLQVISKTAA
ncbi:MAG TPA: GyrI-like domain-containing protein [Anaerolineaceae bacterium]|nr:GyrI-like domain-containing protein [Anaerolineaceae bacterium]HPN50241.1 GyrI-like domain-containing protein [Anaerolineaceae bacterium]